MVGIWSFTFAGAEYASRLLAKASRGSIRRLGGFVRAVQNRRAATALAGLDDRMLADIGITRSDLRDAYAEPLWHDPTDVLVGRAAERRSTRRRSTLVKSSDDTQPAWLACETVSCR